MNTLKKYILTQDNGELIQVPYFGSANDLVDGYIKAGYSAEWTVGSNDDSSIFIHNSLPQYCWQGESKLLKSNINYFKYFDGFGSLFVGKQVAVRLDEKEVEEKKDNEMVTLYIYILK